MPSNTETKAPPLKIRHLRQDFPTCARCNRHEKEARIHSNLDNATRRWRTQNAIVIRVVPLLDIAISHGRIPLQNTRLSQLIRAQDSRASVLTPHIRPIASSHALFSTRDPPNPLHSL